MSKEKILNGIKNIKKIQLKKPQLKKSKKTPKKPNKVKAGIEFHKPGEMLVFETDGTTLYCALAKCGLTSGLSLGGPVKSSNIDFSEAVAEVLEKLKEVTGKKRLPKKAVLITPSAAGEILTLPVDPEKPRLKAQMAEMVRWELEELFVQQGDIWSIGSLLSGMGLISPEQRYEIEDSGEGSSASAYEHLVNNEELESCLELQEKLMVMDEELVTGWLSQGKEASVEGFNWYGAGVPGGIRSLWADAFAANKLDLVWVYPQLGTAASIVGGGLEKWMLIDIRRELVGFIQGQDGQLQSVTFRPTAFGMVDPDLLVQTVKQGLHHDTSSIFVSGPEELVNSLLVELEAGLNLRNLNIFPLIAKDEVDGIPANIINSLRGVARHSLKICKPGLLVRIEGKEPKPPLWKNRALYPWLIMVLLIAGFTGLDTYLKKQTAANEWALELAEIEFAKKKKIVSQARSMASESKQLEKRLTEKEAELAEQQRLKHVLEDIIKVRQDLIPGILEAVAMSVSQAVVLDLLEEYEDRSGFYLQGWALKDTEGQLFATRLNENLHRWNYKVENIKLEKSTGRTGLDGFTLKIWIKRAEG